MKELGIIGFGNFTRFIVKHLTPFFNITVYDIVDITEAAARAGVSTGTLAEAAGKDFVMLAVPVQHLEQVVARIKPDVKPGALLFDVSSVKVKPCALMVREFPESVDIVGLHPLFGPQSGKNGIKGLKIVLCPVRGNRLSHVESFLRDKLELCLFLKTPEEHDREMAYIQGLTHIVGRAINQMDIPDLELKTRSYEFLLYTKDILKDDSAELFKTIQNENPYALELREKFYAVLEGLKKELE